MKELVMMQGGTIEDYFKPDCDVNLKVLMAVTPQSHPPTAPHPAIPYLKGYLEQTLPNLEVTQKDFNAIFFSYIFSSDELAKRFTPEEAGIIREAYCSQRDINVYRDIPKFIEAHQTLENALDNITIQHQTKYGLKKESLRLRGNTFTYVSELSADDRASILKAVSRDYRESNFFYDFYKSKVLPNIESLGYDVVALSIYLPDQVVPAILLASMIKEQDSNRKVVLGGNYLTRFRKTLGKDDELNRRLFDYADAIVVNEGEVPFRKLLEKISIRESFDGINQIIYKREDGKVTINFYQNELQEMDMNRITRPNFDGIFTDLENKENVFWTPYPVISLYTQRGCSYANGCDFCTIMSANNIPNSKIARSPEKVAEDIKFYQENYGAKVFSFGNETLSRNFMIELTRELDRLGLEAVIDGYTRTDQFHNGSLNREMIKSISKYFRFLQIGVESSDEETLDSMRKGRKPFNDSELVEALFQNGIFPHAFLVVGFPPEKKQYEGKDRNDYINFYMKSALSTIRWLYENRRNLGTFKAVTLRVPRDDHKMILETNSDLVISPRYAHELRLKTPKDLEFNIPYDKIHGSTELDGRVTELFDMIDTPYRIFTHNTVYHQRLFNWEEGIRWSLEHPEEADGVSRRMTEKERKVVKRIWTKSVGPDYLEALRELGKKGGISEEKRQTLQTLVQDIRARNIIAQHFPEVIQSVDDFLNIYFE